MVQRENQRKYGQIKEVSFTIDQWLEKSDVPMYSIYNEGKVVVAEISIRACKKFFTNIQQLCQKICILTN